MATKDPAGLHRKEDEWIIPSGTPEAEPGVPVDGPGPLTPPADDPGPSTLPGDIVTTHYIDVTKTRGPDLTEYYLTFPILWERETHPRGAWIHPDGYVTIVAANHTAARRVAFDLFGMWWADLYEAEHYAVGNLDLGKFPKGELLRITVPAGLIESEDHRG